MPGEFYTIVCTARSPFSLTSSPWRLLQIGERLFLALSTVKGHVRMIFDKLQVQRRAEAVARARELDLL